MLADAQAGKLTDEDIIQKRDAMIEEWSRINEKAPRTSPEDYETAKKALKENGEMSCPEQEIDALLPKELRWSEEDKQ